MGLFVLITVMALDSSASAGKRIDRIEALQAKIAVADTTSVRGCDPVRASANQAGDEVLDFAGRASHSPSDFVALVKLVGFAMPCLQDAEVPQVLVGLKTESPALAAAFVRGVKQLDPCRRDYLNFRINTVNTGDQAAPAGRPQPTAKAEPNSFDFAACMSASKR